MGERDNSHCLGCGLRDLVLFADLEAADFDTIHLPISEVAIAAGSALYHAGEEAATLFTLRAGMIKLVRHLPEGTQRIVRLLTPGAAAGLEASLGGHYEHTAIALRDSTLCRIPRPVIQALMTKTPRLHEQLMRRWHQALQDADESLAELSTGKASRRLARLLLRHSSPNGTAPLFGREDLGAILGITTEHASRTVSELRRQGAIVSLLGSDCRVDPHKLRGLADEQE